MRDKLLQDKRLWDLISKENCQQINKWGVQDHDPFRWLSFLGEEMGEINKAVSEWCFRRGTTTEVVKEAIQAATLALKIAEMFMAEEEGKES